MGLLAFGRDRDPPELALDLNPAFTSIAPDAAAPPLPPRNMPVAYAHAAPGVRGGILPGRHRVLMTTSLLLIRLKPRVRRGRVDLLF